MSLRVGVILVMAALAGLVGLQSDGHGLVGDAVNLEEQMMMESEIARRQLGPAGYISYGALARNSAPPCGIRGQSYYNCRAHQVANPYTRGCSRITYCVRATH